MRPDRKDGIMIWQSCFGGTTERSSRRAKEVISMADKPTKKPATDKAPKTPTAAKKPKREKGKQKK
jgi:hypothetical protein